MSTKCAWLFPANRKAKDGDLCKELIGIPGYDITVLLAKHIATV